jgi:hypothetical protein
VGLSFFLAGLTRVENVAPFSAMHPMLIILSEYWVASKSIKNRIYLFSFLFFLHIYYNINFFKNQKRPLLQGLFIIIMP